MKKFTRVLLVLLGMTACGGSDDGGVPPQQPPSAATLLFPADNTECNEGVVLSDTQSTVTFEWNASANTDSYQLHIRNLNTSQVQTLNTNTTQLNVTLLRGTPYAWWVVSANTTTQTAQSGEWKFYNAGLATEHYAPFPAEVLNPKTGTAVDAAGGEVSLLWEGEDVDGDLTEYDVYFDTVNPPVVMREAGLPAPSLNVTVVPAGIYYWRVISRDAQGNTSASEVFEFRVN